MTTIDFTVRGLPVAQGSVRAFVRGNRAVVVGVSSPLAAWRHAIATEARAAIEDAAPLSGPVSVMLAFRFARPQSHYLPANAKRPVRVLRLDAPDFMARTPDADKLARASLDALTAVVWIDDAQVAVLTVVKKYVSAANPAPGVRISVRSLPVTL